MLTFQHPPQMPHAHSTALHLPPPVSFARVNGDKDRSYHIRSNKSSSPPRLPPVGQLTPLPDMSSHLVLDYGNSSNNNYGSNSVGRSDVGMAFRLMSNTFQSTYGEGSYSHPNSLQAPSVGSQIRTPESSRTLPSVTASLTEPDSQISPALATVSSTLAIPHTISVPQKDLSELAAEVRFRFADIDSRLTGSRLRACFGSNKLQS